MTTTNTTPTPVPTVAAPSAALKTTRPVRAQKPVAAPAKKAPVKVAAKKAPMAPKAAPLKTTIPTPLSAEKNAKPKKPKLVRDSFTIPKDEYAVIETLKQRAATLKQPVKKSELLRAGLKVLAGMSDTALRDALKAVPLLKTGRPKAEQTLPIANTKTARKK